MEIPGNRSIPWLRNLVLAAALLLVFGLLVQPLVDPDVYVHLRDGRFWTESHFQFHADSFTYTLPKTAYDPAEWLFRVLLYGLWTLGGFNLLIIFKAVILTLAVGLILRLLFLRWPHTGAVMTGMTIGVFALTSLVFGERPFIFTYLFLPLVLILLERAGTAPVASVNFKQLWLIPPLVWLWANLHPAFAVVFIFLFARIIALAWAQYRTPNTESWSRLKTLILIALLSFVAGLLTPQGWDIYAFALKTPQTPIYMQTINEWLPPNFSQQPFFFILFGLVVVSFFLVFPNCAWADLLPLIIFSYLTFQSRRHIPLFVLAALPPLLTHARRLREHPLGHWKPKLFAEPLLLTGMLLLLCGTMLYAALHGPAFRLGKRTDFYPTQALAWSQSQALQGRWFMPYSWGGYVGWETHGKQPVFMDGRIPFFGEKLYQDYCRIYYGAPECLGLLDQYQIDVLLVSPKNYFSLFEQLSRSGKWALIYWDHVAEIFVRRDGLNKSLAGALEYRVIDPNATPYFNPTQPQAALLEVQRARQTAPDSYLPEFFEGDVLLQLGQFQKGRERLQEVIRKYPDYVHAYISLGQLALKEKKWNQAETFFKSALNCGTEAKNQAKGFYLLAVAQSQQPGRTAQALRSAYRAQALAPEQLEIQKLIEQLQPMQP
jgi:hypothetical protein